jgi:hypothetical protein
MKMIASRPLPWAVGTGFDPYYDDLNEIAIQFNIKDRISRTLYEQLLKWIEANVPDTCIALVPDMAETLWNNLSK